MNRLAINGGKPAKTKAFPDWPLYDNREKELLNKVLESRAWWRVTGSMVNEFEMKFAKMQGAKYCLGVTNGTHAMELALTAMGVRRGDEVIVPAMTFISTALAVLACGATPVLVDIDPRTFCMLPQSFEKAITKRTKVVIPVHMAGHACDMDRICEIASKFHIMVLEDAAHAHGAEWKSRRIGSFGEAAIFSFQNGKLMTCGEGGAVVINRKELYDSAYLMQDVGRPKNDKIYEHVVMGSNFRMNEFQAAILLAQMERVDELNILRDRNSVILDRLFEEVEGIMPQGRDVNANVISHYMYMFHYDSNYFGGLTREKFVELLNAEGVPACVCFPVLSDTQFFKENNFNSRLSYYNLNDEAELKNARKIARDVVWLHHRTLEGDVQDLQEIVEAISKIQSVFMEKN